MAVHSQPRSLESPAEAKSLGSPGAAIRWPVMPRSSSPPSLAPTVLDVPPPPGWRKERGPLGAVYRRRHDDLAVMVTTEGAAFAMSVSRQGRAPSEGDVRAALAAFAPGAREVTAWHGDAQPNGRRVAHVEGVLPANDRQ